ncbi:8494_t:CDS:2 [Cetraspora pellucida]|uniref:ATP-dependent DNA helicase n=1 Tax=Cetraspora pellucida TaxID=1433469 RepID=A0A9N8Z3X8_9GLOM|nr:8494_t:CDS:2 [Cetraspora pellucida]
MSLSDSVHEFRNKLINKKLNYNIQTLIEPTRTVKTFLYNNLLAKVHFTRNIALAVASSGIVALLLDENYIAYSQFKIPIELYENLIYNIYVNTDYAMLLKQAILFIWDKALMMHYYAFKTQILSVIPKDKHKDIRNICFCYSYL